ncbi:MAG: phenylalanine--tRNA ligase subunit beta [Deltaproteobacteria bacterium]|nr:phenylalanine--tRNA ligase subunit beta [Deltaproteobacteria bacterium]
MLFSYNWLKEYLDRLPEPKVLADALTMSGTEVESVTPTGARLTNVVTAQVLSCDKHPNADKLQLCSVKTDTEEFSIVCGAKNMLPGDKVVLALAGAELPGGIKIKRSKIRGVESQGMMCSEVELGIKDTSNGIMILPEDTPLGKDITGVLGLDDFMMEVGITPNRADLLSVRGLSREVAAVTGATFRDKSVKVEETGGPVDEIVTVSIETGAPCRRYTARVIEGVTVAPSPDAIKRRLEAHGIRSINNVVDATNLVLLELGQPLHAFDLDKVGNRSIDVRLAGEAESLETIDGKVRKLDPSMLVIADSDGPVALAGIMGGRSSEVSDTTAHVLLESAWFEPSTVRRTSRKAGLSSDSSYRFERGVDMEGVRVALDMAASLIKRLAGGRVAKGVVDIYPEEFVPASIDFRRKRAEELLGIDLTDGGVKEIFDRLGIVTKESSEKVLTVIPPSYRLDLKNETDLVEEVARIFGYNNIPTTLPMARLMPGHTGRLFGIRNRVKEILTNHGFYEVINYSFVSRETFASTGPEGKKGVIILNPLSEDQVVMRDHLLPSLLENLKKNLSRKNEQVKIFEFAPVYLPGGKLPIEKWRAAGLMYGFRWDESWNQTKDGLDFFDCKGVVEKIFEGLALDGFEVKRGSGALFHPGKCAAVTFDGKAAGIFGEAHPDVVTAYGFKKAPLLFELEMDAVMEKYGLGRKYRALPKFPESTRDIAFIVRDDVPYGEIISSIEELDTNLIERVELFDVYCGGNIPPGKRSMALRTVYRSMERTLTAQEVEDIHARVSARLTGKFGAEVRGEAGSQA